MLKVKTGCMSLQCGIDIHSQKEDKHIHRVNVYVLRYHSYHSDDKYNISFHFQAKLLDLMSNFGGRDTS